MTLSISPVVLEDAERVAIVRRRAFANTTIDRLCFGNVTEADHVASFKKMIAKNLKNADTAMWKAERDGQIIGLAIWGTPHPYKEPDSKAASESPEEKRKRLEERYPVGTDYDLADEFFSSLDLGIKEPHYHLGILVVDPNVQRSGAGSALLRWGSTQADKHGLDCYLEATPAGIPVYQRAGYELFGDSIKGGPDGVMELWPMRRRPLECRVATEQDFYTLAQLHREAFQPTKWYQALWGQVEPQAFEEWLLPQLKQWAKNTSDRLVIAVRGNTVLGYAHWEIKHGPQEWSEEQAGTLGAAHPVGTNVEVASAFSRDMGRYNASVEGDYWHLHILATSPRLQRSGAGKALIEWGAKPAHAQGLPVYLEGGDEAMEFYHKLGFVVCGQPVAGICGTFQDTPLVLHPIMVSPATVEDIDALATLHRRAFRGSEFNEAMFSQCSDDALDQWNAKRMRKWLDAAKNGVDTQVRVARRGGVILGYAQWENMRRPLNHGHEGKDSEKKDEAMTFNTDDLPAGTDFEVAKRISDVMDQLKDRIKEPRYSYLHRLATWPHKTGAGLALMQSWVQECEKTELSMYLDSTVAGKRLYDSSGFKVWDAPIQALPRPGCEVFPMRKQAPVTVTSATSRDIPDLAVIHRRAFASSVLYKVPFSDCTDQAVDDWNENRMKKWLNPTDGKEHWTAIARRGNAILGYAHWDVTRPDPAADQTTKSTSSTTSEPLGKDDFPVGADLTRARIFWDMMERQEAKITVAHAMLHQLASEPAHQGSGAGRALVQWGENKCVEAGLDMYLDATLAGKRLYESFGFTAWDEPLDVVPGQEGGQLVPMRKNIAKKT